MTVLKKKPEMAWIVVVVESGIPILAEVHRDEVTARQRERFFCKDAREDYDAVGVFEVEIGAETFA
jgi:hypothetical protein